MLISFKRTKLKQNSYKSQFGKGDKYLKKRYNIRYISEGIYMLLNKLLYSISGLMKCKIIKGEEGQPYLERYMVARWGKNGEHTIFLHRFLDSDPDRGIHDHPWDSKSFILAGGYNEKRLINENGQEKVIIRDIKPFTINKIGKNDFHQIILKKKTPAWTLFYHGPRVKHWGFQNYKLNPKDNSIERETFTPYQDNTNPTEKWENKAPVGKNAPREHRDYIFNKM